MLGTHLSQNHRSLSPEPNCRCWIYKSMILDHAAELIAAEGISAASMERLGREAGISKALVYTYFPSLEGLLQTLLKREYKQLRILQNGGVHIGPCLL